MELTFSQCVVEGDIVDEQLKSQFNNPGSGLLGAITLIYDVFTPKNLIGEMGCFMRVIISIL